MSGYELITTHRALQRATRDAGPDCGLDFETTALSPENGRVRLVSLCSPTVRAVVDFDRMGGFDGVAQYFERKTRWWVFNAGFEMRWFEAAYTRPIIRDVQNLRRAVLGGSKLSLAMQAQYDLGITLSKEQQLSDWTAQNLTTEQLDYAFRDAEVTFDLFAYWNAKMDDGQRSCAEMFDALVPAVIEMEEAGMLLDTGHHASLVARWRSLLEKQERRIREMVSEQEVANLNSQHQWNDFLVSQVLAGQDALLRSWPRTEKTGMLSTTAETLRLISAHTRASWPVLADLCDALADYKKLEKYVSSFGDTLINAAQMSADGRIRARFNIAAAKTCRFSSSGPNLQQTPRNQGDFFGEAMSIRRSFIAVLEHKLVSLDYSGIELRVLALLSGDKQLLQDVLEGDLHSEVASFGAGYRIDKTTPEGKALRTAAKAVSFGIIYGSGATGLAGTMKTTVAKAQDYIDFWADRYPKAFGLRHEMMAEAQRTKHLRMIDGGTIYLGAKPDLPKCANYPVQRAALSIMARAIIRHKARLERVGWRCGRPHLKILATIHDALIDEVINQMAEEALAWMEEDMLLAYLDIFPNAPTEQLTEGGIGDSWGDL